MQETGAGTGVFTPLGTIDTYNTAGTLAAYYNFNFVNASYNGPAPTAVSEETLFFFVAGSNGLGFFTVIDLPNDGTAGTANIAYALSGSPGSTVRVSDDAGELTGGAGAFTGAYTWVSCCTDGGVIGPITGNWVLDVSYTSTPTGITGTTVMNGPGDTVFQTFGALANGQRIRFQPAAAAVPEPATVLLFGAGLLGFVALRRRKGA